MNNDENDPMQQVAQKGFLGCLSIIFVAFFLLFFLAYPIPCLVIGVILFAFGCVGKFLDWIFPSDNY